MFRVVEKDDADEVEAVLLQAFDCRRITMSEERHHVRIAAAEAGRLQLNQIAMRMRISCWVPATGMVVVGRVRSGTVEYTSTSGTFAPGAGGLLLPAAPGEDFQAMSDDLDAEYARFPGEILTQLVDEVPGRRRRAITFAGNHPVSASAARTWNRVYEYVRDTLTGPDAEDQPILVGTAVQTLAAVTLATFANDAVREPTIEDRHDARAPALRRAVAFIEENADRVISLADIAAAAHTTIRSLQLMFRSHLDTTPTAYLRQVRLDRAHRELLAADPVVTTVSAVAMRWGFASHSTFAAHYRIAYGMSPSRTLYRK